MKILDVPQSGSVAGVTSSRNRFGQYRRTRAVPVNPNSAAQVAVRNSFADTSQAWDALTGSQRLAWTNYAALHPRTDSLGQSITLSGSQAFVGINSLLLLLGLAIVLVPPAEPAFTPGDITGMAEAGGLIDVEIAAAISANEWLCYCSPPKTQGTSFNGDYRFLGALALAAAPESQDITALVTAKFGTIQSGRRFFFRFVQQIGGVKAAPLDFVLDIS